MTDNLHTPTRETTDVQSPGNTSPGDHTAASECRSGMMACGMGHKGLKGLLLMAACCGAPVLLLLALPMLGATLGSLGISALSILAGLACPIGMALMMWMMMRAQHAEAGPPVQAQPAAVPEMGSTASAQPQEAAVRLDIPDPRETTVTLPTPVQAEVVTSPHPVNGHQTAAPTPGHSRSQAATPPHE